MKTNYGAFIDDNAHKTALELWDMQEFFSMQELVPREVFLARGEKAIELFSPESIISLIETRVLFDAPINLNTWVWGGGFSYRGFRPGSYYKTTSYSQHSLANAFDYDVKGYTAEEARQQLIQWKREGKLSYLTGIEEDVNWVNNDYRITNRLDNDGLFLFSA